MLIGRDGKRFAHIRFTSVFKYFFTVFGGEFYDIFKTFVIAAIATFFFAITFVVMTAVFITAAITIRSIKGESS